MGVFDGIKGFYFKLEEKYYDFLDSVNAHVPIYEIIDPIDKVVPSFLLFIALFLAAAGLVLAGVFGLGGLGNDTLTISVQDSDANPISDATVTFSRDDSVVSSVQTDALGIAVLAGVKQDESIEVVAEKDSYLSSSKTIIIASLPAAENILLDLASQASSERTIRLLDELGQPVSGSFTLRFKCSNPYAPAIADVLLSGQDRGVARVNMPGNCERLSVDVLDGGTHSDIYGQVVSGEDQAIYLEAEETGDAKIVVNVSDASGNALSGIEVQLYKYSELIDNPNVGPIDVAYTSGGQATFTKSPGSYAVKAYDSQGQFDDKVSGKITAVAAQSATVNLALAEDIKGKVLVKVIDKRSGAAIHSAQVSLFYAAATSKDAPINTVPTAADGTAGINVSRDSEFKAIVSASEYQSVTIGGLRIGTTAATVQLEKCTPSTCGLLKVKVVDQDGSPIDGAIVTLYNASTNFQANYAGRTADINGLAKFSGISNGNYYAFAFKEGFSGRSDAGYFSSDQNKSDAQNLTVTMNVDDGIAAVKVRDTDGRPIAFATIGLFDARTNALVGRDLTDSNGSKEFSLKANRKIYVVVSKQDEQVYANYISAKRAMIPSGVQQFDVTLEKPILSGEISMEFLGMHSADGKRAENLKAGDTYRARFKVRVPEEKDYGSMGVHVRAGSDVLMEKDALFIKEVNAPRTSQVRATRFEDERGGLDEGDYDLTIGDAKWANLTWSSTSAGIYEVEAEIGVRESASIGDKLFLNYRTWGEYRDGKRDRFPKDDTVTKELYSNTKQEVFQVGVVTLCDEDFCFTATVTDNRNDLIESVQDTYNAKVFNPYRLQFIITNNSETRIHNSANLRIGNADESLKFFDYKITDAETQPTSGTLNGFEFPRLNVGDLRPKNSVRFESEFTPQKSISGILNVRLVSDQDIVFEKNITVIIAAPKELDVQIEPSVFLSGIENDISVIVTDKANGLEIEGAIVRVKDGHKNVLDYDVTGKDGNSMLTLPGQKPGKKLYLEIEKTDYNVKLIELAVSDRLLEITPSQIGVSVNTKNKQQSEDKITLRNVAPYPLKITDIRLTGDFKKLLDTARIRNWLESSYREMVIEPDEKKDVTLKTFLSQDALALSNRATLEGTLVIVATNFGQEWVFNVPAKIAVGLGDEVDDPTCLVVTKGEWTTSTSGTPKRTEFQIQNNCTVGKRPVALQNLEAKIGWKTNQLGEYTLNIGPDEVTLRPGYYRILLGTLKPEQSLTAILTFTPFGGVSGAGEADIVIQATNPLEDEDQALSNTIKTKITSVNLKQCLSYDKERLSVNQNESGAVTITATEVCGEGVDFEIKSDLMTTPRSEFTLQPGQSQVVQIFAEKNYPGQYALFIEPKFASDKKEQLVKNIRVIVNAPGCWQLSKYEFDVFDDKRNEFDGLDSADLTNNCVQRPVTVKVNAKDWMDAAQDGLFWGLGSMAAVMLTNYGKGDYDIWGNTRGTVSLGQVQYSKNATGDWIGPDGQKVTDASLKSTLNAKQSGTATPFSSAVVNGKTAYKNSSGQWYDQSGVEIKDDSQKQAYENALKKAPVMETVTVPNPETIAPVRDSTQSTAAPQVSAQAQAEINSLKLQLAEAQAKLKAVGAAASNAQLQQSKDLQSQLVQKRLEIGSGLKITPPDQVTSTDIVTPGIPVQQTPEPTSVDIPIEAADEVVVYGSGLYYIKSNGRVVDYWLGTEVDQSTAIEVINTSLRNAEKPAGPVGITGQAVLPSAQGLAPYTAGSQQQSGATSGIFGGLAQGAGNSLSGNLLSGGGGIVRGLLGSNPWVGGLTGFVVGTAISYFGQEKEVTFTVLQKDTEIKSVRVIQGSGPAEKDDKDIAITVQGIGGKKGDTAPTVAQPLANTPDLISQGIENIKLTFQNASGFTTSEEQPKTPAPNLKVAGVRHNYKDRVYDKKDFVTETGGFLGFFDQPLIDKGKTKLDEEAEQKLEQQYRLEFNSIPPTVETSQPLGLLNCQDGTRTGSTGSDALPKVKLGWSWAEIREDTCNESNENGVYCDATQLSISLLRKVDAISKYVSQNGGQFTCPSPLEDEAAENNIGSFDIGVESVSAVKKGNDIEIVANIKNTNPGIISGTVAIRAKAAQGGAEIACQTPSQNITVAAGGQTEVSCTFAGLPQGFYSASAALTPSVSCPNCQDIAATNSLSRNFFAGTTGLQQCSPYSTTRLSDFLRASGMKNDAVLAMTKFNALLMVDGYGADFQRDFDVAQKQAFFSAPDMYTNPTIGLGNYFKDTKLWSFDAYSQPDFTLPGPGTYSISADITYNDNTWQLYDSKGNPNAKITITMEKLHGAEPDSPFYYVPFDGLVGQDSGRVGYGVNFAGDSILIDNSQTPIRTVEISGSSPINDGVLSVTKSESFKSMQVDERGVVAKLSRQGGSPTLLFQPSNATPVILQITKKTGEDAYAIYEPAVDGDAVDVGPQLAQWNGIGASCRAFDDSVMSQQQFVPDTHGLSTRCALVGPNQRSKYALEFCGNMINYGTVSYETVFYTPQESDSYLQLTDVASDDAVLVSASSTAKKVPLNGNGATDDISSMQDVFNLVQDGYMCVSGTNLNAEFFWNPKKVFETFQGKEEAALDACIQATNRRG